MFTDTLVPKTVIKPYPGKLYGCSDSGPPETNSAYRLSRVADAIYALDQAGLDIHGFWQTLPKDVRLEWNWSRWHYVPAK